MPYLTARYTATEEDFTIQRVTERRRAFPLAACRFPRLRKCDHVMDATETDNTKKLSTVTVPAVELKDR